MVSNSKGQYLLYGPQRIFVFNIQEGSFNQLFEESENLKLAKVPPVFGFNSVYYVETDIEQQIDHIVMIMLNPGKGNMIMRAPKRIFSMPESGVVCMQLCSDIQQRRDADYNGTKWQDKPTEMFVLDKSPTLYKLRMVVNDTPKRNGTMREIARTKLVDFDEDFVLNESICFSDRTITWRNKVYSNEMESDEYDGFSPFSDENLNEDENIGQNVKIQPYAVPFSNLILYNSPTTCQQILQGDAGRRGLPFGHAQLFKDLASVHQVSADLLLMELFDNAERTASYWTTITLEGQIGNVPKELAKQLPQIRFAAEKANGEEDGEVNSEAGELEKKLLNQEFAGTAQSRMILGGITQIVLNSEDKIRVLRVNSQCELLSCQDYARDKGAYVKQNFFGEILQVKVLYGKDQFEYKEAQDGGIPVLKVGKIMNPDVLIDIVYLKDYLCVMPVTKKEREGHNFLVYSLKQSDFTSIKIGHDELAPNEDAIDECPPLTQLRQLRYDAFTDDDLTNICNRLQLSNDKHSHIIQIYRDDESGMISCSMKAREISEDQQLEDPNNFVEPGLNISTIDEGKNNQKSRKTDLQSMVFGNIVSLTQRVIERDVSPKNLFNLLKQSAVGEEKPKIYHRSYLGLYRRYARVDLDARELLDNADVHEGIQCVDVKGLLAQFNNVNCFTYNQNILKYRAILETLQEKDQDSDALDLSRIAQKLTEKRFGYCD